MKKKSLKLRLPYFFGQRFRGTDSLGNIMPELIKPESEWERDESGIEDILRWADDGGPCWTLETEQSGRTRMQLGNGETKDERPQKRKVSGSNDSRSHEY